MTNAIVFVGPSLPREDARRELNATYLNPVSQGDLYRSALERPFAIGIIDGYFERVPAVWHKEILWALTQGIHVFGASSMGALRAAELSRFGMKGVGAIFEAYDSGELEDDDEVAVAHGDASTGYRAVSEAMVNIRATLKHAENSGVISSDLRQHLEVRAKALFYPDRSFPQLYSLAADDGISNERIEALRAFVTNERIDQKRLDAIQLLRTMRECCEKGEPPAPSTFSFAHTEVWDQVVDWAETQPPITLQSQSSSADLLAAEVRLLGSAGHAIIASGFNRVAAGALAHRAGMEDESDRRARLDREFRRAACDRDGGTEFQIWLQKQGLTDESYETFLDHETQLGWFCARYRDVLDHHVVDELRKLGKHAALSERAREKDELLRQQGLATPTLKDAGMDQHELLSWYFEICLGQPVPADLEEYLVSCGLEHVNALEREALREYLFQKISGKVNLGNQDTSHGTNPKFLHQPDPPP